MGNRKIIFLFFNQNICKGYSKEPSHWDGSFEHPKHMSNTMGKKIFTILRWKFLFYLNLWTYVTPTKLPTQLFYRIYQWGRDFCSCLVFESKIRDFFVFLGAKFQTHSQSQWDLVNKNPNLEEKNPNFKKNMFFFEDWDFHSVNTHKIHGDILLQFNGNSMCNS